MAGKTLATGIQRTKESFCSQRRRQSEANTWLRAQSEAQEGGDQDTGIHDKETQHLGGSGAACGV